MSTPIASKLTFHDEDVFEDPAPMRRRLASVLDLDVDPLPAAVVELPRVRARRVRALGPAAIHRRLLGIADGFAAVATLLLADALFGHGAVSPLVLAGVPLVVLLFKVAGLYDRDEMRLTHSTLDEAPQLMQLTGVMALVSAALAPVMLHAAISGGHLAVLWAGLFITVFAARSGARALAGRLSPVERCLVVGETDRAQRIREKLAAAKARAVVVASLPVQDQELTGLGGAEAVRYLVDQLELDRLIIAPSSSDGRGVTELIRVGKALGLRVSVQPGMLEAVGSSVEFDDLDGMTLLGVRQFGLSRSSRVVKRASDVVATSIGMIAVAPLMLVIAALIRLDTPGPILYRQTRVGRDGRHFSIFKFRSMVVDAHQQRDDLRALNVAGDGLFKIVDDPRVTRVGRLLRRTSLDELPQLLNVLRGEMSLVGPRPLVVDEDAQVLGLDRSRLHLTPGMTGPWQVLGMRVPMAEMVSIDYLYVANWSLWLDLKLLARTVRHVLRRGNV